MNNSNDQENLSTEQSPSREEARISLADGDEKRTRGNRPPPRERSQTPDAAPLLNPEATPAGELKTQQPEKIDFTLPKAHRLRKPGEFKHVYAKGRKFEGRLMTAFVLSNDLQHHRLGITASRKGVGNAVQRNRAKRLLREAFRLSKAELNELTGRYEIVLNARRGLLKVKMPDALADLQKIIGQIKTRENLSNNEKPVGVNLTAK